MKRLIFAVIAVLLGVPAFGQVGPIITPGGDALAVPVTVGNGGTGSATGVGLFDTCTDSVGTDAYACSTATTCPASLAATRPVLFTAGTANTGAATFAYCGLAAKAVVKTIGGISTALADNDILAKQPVLVRYNATDDNWKMVSAISNAPAAAVTVGGAITGGTANRGLFETSTNTLGQAAGWTVSDTGLTVIGTGITTGVPLTVNNATSTGNMLTVQDNGSPSFEVRDGSTVQLGATSNDRWLLAGGYGGGTGYMGTITYPIDFGIGYGGGTATTLNPSFYTLTLAGFSTTASKLFGGESHTGANIQVGDSNGTYSKGKYIFAGTKNTLTGGVATEIITVALAAGEATGGTIEYTVFATDATDHQARHGMVRFAIVNKAGTETCNVYGVDSSFTANPNETQDGSGAGAMSTGTLTYSWSTDTSGSNQCVLKLNATSSLTETTFRSNFSARLSGPGTITTVVN